MKIITGIFWVIEDKIIFKKHYAETNDIHIKTGWTILYLIIRFGINSIPNFTLTPISLHFRAEG